MITRYEYGKPIDTGAVVQQLPAAAGEPQRLTAAHGDDGSVSFSLRLQKEDMIFGLGQSVRGINKRGSRCVAWAADDPNHTQDKASLYGAHNFLVFVTDTGCFGVYVDDPGRVVFDLGYTRTDEAVITSENGDLSLYVIEEADAAAVCRAFRGLIGRSYVPPRWGMGYIQSRWGYRTAEDIRQVLQGHRSRHIPLDGLSMDIDYMDDFKDFTVGADKFPDLTAFSAELASQHARLVPIIDAGVKLEEGYDVCDEGLQQGYFCKKADGTPFVGAVWPGRCVFPDFLRQDVRAWFGEKYHRLLRCGVEGFWNDMNEPALFYSDDSLREAFGIVEELRGQELNIWGTFKLKDAILNIANNQEDYRRFYQETNRGAVRHDKVHNLYGAHMTRAAAEGMRSYDPDKRYLLFARSSFIGAHRYGGIWQGDNCAWWSHILLNLKEMAGLNMCGFLFNGADIGGFGCNTSPDLTERWLQLGVFTPLMRNHAALGTRDQEIYRFDNWTDMRDTLTVRYALLPYLYSELVQAALTDGMMFRPLAFDYPADRVACHTEDQLMLGRDCMIAPVYEQNAVGRHVYLPQDMLLIRFRSAADYDMEPLHAGHHWVPLALNEFPLFIRRGHVVPMAAAAESTDELDDTAFTLLGWLGQTDTVATDLYRDDGVTADMTMEKVTAITVNVRGGDIHAAGEGMTLDPSRIILQ